MSEREDVAAKRNKCLGAQQAFREALAALEALPQQLTALAGRTTSQALPPDAASWSEPAPISKSSTGKRFLSCCTRDTGAVLWAANHSARLIVSVAGACGACMWICWVNMDA